MLYNLLFTTKPSKIIRRYILRYNALSFLLVFFLIAAAPPPRGGVGELASWRLAPSPPPPLTPSQKGVSSPIPLLAYYEIGFDLPTWEAYEGEDLPMLGRYSSDDLDIMRRHIRLAQSVGIKGFIVGWRNDEILNRRLAKLVEVAEAEEFYLGIRYLRDESLSPEEAAAQLDYIATEYGDSIAFQLFQRPLVIWPALASFSSDELFGVMQPRRSVFLMLVSSENPEDYQKMAHLVDGNALFRESTHQEELASLGRAVHAEGGLWIPPVSPGATVELNEDGEMIIYPRTAQNLRRQMNQAIQSSPDAMAIISWNDFETDTHIEPSEEYGTSSIDVLKEINGIVVPPIPDFDSSAPGETLEGPIDIMRLSSMGVMVGFFLISVIVLVRRDLKATKMEEEEEE